MSNHPGVQEIREMLERLQAVVADFAAREKRIDHDLRVRTYARKQQRDEALEEAEKKRTDALGGMGETVEEAREKEMARYEARAAWLVRASASSRQGRVEADDQWEGGQKNKLQRQMLQTSRDRDSGIKAAEQAHEEFQEAVGASREAFAGLEDRAHLAFRGYGRFLKMLAAEHEPTDVDTTPDEHQLMEDLGQLQEETEGRVRRFRWMLLPALFRIAPLPMLIVFILVFHLPVLPPVLRHFGVAPFAYEAIGQSVAGFLAGVFFLYFAGLSLSRTTVLGICNCFAQARRLHETCEAKETASFEAEKCRLEAEYEERTAELEKAWNAIIKEASRKREETKRRTDEQVHRLRSRIEERHAARLKDVEEHHSEHVARLKRESEEALKQARSDCEKALARFEEEHREKWRELEEEWRKVVEPLHVSIMEAVEEGKRLARKWEAGEWDDWAPPPKFGGAACLARLEVNLPELAGTLPEDGRLRWPGPEKFSLPVTLEFPERGSLLIETSKDSDARITAAMNNLVLRLLLQSPPGRLSFTIVDPVGLGQNFAGIMHLADYEEHLISRRIWTQSTQIEQRLGELNEHMEKVIQMYLRNEYPTIADYNEQAGNIAEKYHFLVVANFPSAFSETAIKRLMNITANGGRCGVFTLIHWDERQPAPQDLVPAEIRKNSVRIVASGKDFKFPGWTFGGVRLKLDLPPEPEFMTDLVHRIGKANRDSNRIEVPFDHVTPPADKVWSVDTTTELQVPIGRTGATKLQYLAIGKGTCQHALIAGKTGSGKSTLFHVLITNLALWCSPEQVEFYLIDFKKGVEFKCYGVNRLPHARVVAIESDREFGLSVLQRLDEELKCRGDLFRELGVQDIPGYKKAKGAEPMPRSLLLIDEFQELFVEDDRVAQNAAVLLDRIVRQGRAFGIHVILGSQTLGGAFTLARSTLGQMVIRIALQCNEADAYLIMDDSNPAPRLLSRPGEGIYNDSAGALEGNSPFQVVWLNDDERDECLAMVRERADRELPGYAGPIVFEGNAPADVRENVELAKQLAAKPDKAVLPARAWLGAPNAIKGPTHASFSRQSGSNLLIVGQRDEAALAMLGVSLLSLAAQFPRDGARFVIVDGHPPEAAERKFLDRVVAAVPHEVQLLSGGEVEPALGQLAAGLRQRSEGGGERAGAETFIFVNGLQKFKKLRHEEDFGFSADEDEAPKAGAVFNDLICDGPGCGFHVIAVCDTFNNVNRCLSRKALTEFEMRVLFQMSANDSASLIDSPKAGNLGLHRALLYNESQGSLETFRPYSLPNLAWIEEAGNRLAG